MLHDARQSYDTAISKQRPLQTQTGPSTGCQLEFKCNTEHQQEWKDPLQQTAVIYDNNKSVGKDTMTFEITAYLLSWKQKLGRYKYWHKKCDPRRALCELHDSRFRHPNTQSRLCQRSLGPLSFTKRVHVTQTNSQILLYLVVTFHLPTSKLRQLVVRCKWSCD